MISQLQTITIYVRDLDRALRFYIEKPGFVQTVEFKDERQHLVRVVPADAVRVDRAAEIALFDNDIWAACLHQATIP